MKRTELLRQLGNAGCALKRHGSSHDIYRNLKNGRSAAIPRHNEIKDTLVAQIRKQLGI